ncbi:MAG: DUF3888 domain-containing protein [Clostridiaceae bacterium]
MKKVQIIIYLIISLSFLSFNTFATNPTYNAEYGIPEKYTPSEGSIEELYKDIIVTLIEPYISKEIENYYGTPLQYDLFDMEFLKIERPNYRSFTFKIVVQVKPFVGAHNTIGIDEATIMVSPVKTEVINFKHIKTIPY